MKISVAVCAISFSSWVMGSPLLVLLKDAQSHRPRVSVMPSVTPVILTTHTQLSIPSKVAVEEEFVLEDTLESRSENRPFAPSHDVTPSEALAAPRPLKTSYLLSLLSTGRNQAPLRTSQEESSTVREETGSAMRTQSPTTVELETEGAKPSFYRIPCRMSGSPDHFHKVRKHADMVIIGVVFSFLAMVLLVELWQPICRSLEKPLSIWSSYEHVPDTSIITAV